MRVALLGARADLVLNLEDPDRRLLPNSQFELTPALAEPLT
jgi:hypothetical protein